jgi:aminoglycoside 3-N-acetyltransferase
MSKKFFEILDDLEIVNGDVLIVASDVVGIAIQVIREKKQVDLNGVLDVIIDNLKNAVGNSGTLLFPTYNWDFCKGENFDYNKTESKTGILTQRALDREDFVRTKHPIYSFTVWGKDQEILCSMDNISSFGKDSPFAYLYNKNAKMLMIDVDYQQSFTFVHFVEEQEKVNYRYTKNFEGHYISQDGNSFEATYSMCVRNLDESVVTRINPIGEILEAKKASWKYIDDEISYRVVNLKKAYEVIKNDINQNESKNLFYYDV